MIANFPLPLRVLLIDDEEPVRNILKIFLTRFNNILLLGECGTVSDAKVLIKNTQPDLVFLDIRLLDGTAFDLLLAFPNPNFKIIFITAYEQYVLKALRAGALDYLMKPIDIQEFTVALEKANSQSMKPEQYETSLEHWQEKPTKITFRSREGLHIVPLQKLLYCESDGGYTTFFLLDGSKLIASKPMKEYSTILPESSFIRLHQSYIVNINYITLFKNENMVVLKNDSNFMKEIPVSSRKRDELLKLLEG